MTTWFDDEGAPVEVERDLEVFDPDEPEPGWIEAAAEAGVPVLEPIVMPGTEAPVDLIERQNATDENVRLLTSNVDRLIGLVEAALGPKSDPLIPRYPEEFLSPDGASGSYKITDPYAAPEPVPTEPEPEFVDGIDPAFLMGTMPEITGPGTREPANRSTYRGD